MAERASRPLISFLVSAFRTERYIAETINSVLAQTRSDWELIVVDNGNSDEMARIVERFTDDPRITLIRQENKGLLGGVSAAAGIATGRYLCAFSSDDLLRPEFCQVVGDLVERHPGVDAVGSDAELFSSPEERVPQGHFESVGRKKSPDPSHAVSLADLLEDGLPQPIGVIRREAWDELDGFDPARPDIEADVILWLRLAASGRDVRILPDRLVRIRLRPESLSHDPANIEEFEKRLQGAFLAISDHAPISEAEVRGARMFRRLRYSQELRRARWAFRDGDVPAARAAARNAFREKHTVRAATVILGLQLSPGLLRVAHPVKGLMMNAWAHARFRVTHGGA
jgi:Glycosyl transferase family 2